MNISWSGEKSRMSAKIIHAKATLLVIDRCDFAPKPVLRKCRRDVICQQTDNQQEGNNRLGAFREKAGRVGGFYLALSRQSARTDVDSSLA